MCLNQIWTVYKEEGTNQKSKRGVLKNIKMLYKVQKRK